MILGNLDTRVAAEQLRLLFDVRNIFARRGRRVSSLEDETRLLFDPRRSQEVYQAMTSLSFRRVVARVANARESVNAAEIMEELSSGIQEGIICECLQRAVLAGCARGGVYDDVRRAKAKEGSVVVRGGALFLL